MPTSSRSQFLPPFTPDELDERDQQERRLNKQLQACERGDSFDIERAFQVMRSYTVEIFRVVYPAYRKRTGYETDWLPEIVDETIHRVLVTSEQHVRYEIRDLTELGNELERTLINHLRSDPTLIAPSDVEEAFPKPKKTSRSLSSPPPPPEVQAQMEGRSVLAHVSTGVAQPEVKDQKMPPSSQPATKSKIADELRRLLKAARIRPEDIAEEIGIEARNVYRHLAEETEPSLVNIGKYEKALSRHLGKPVRLPTPERRRRVSKTSLIRQ